MVRLTRLVFGSLMVCMTVLLVFAIRKYMRGGDLLTATGFRDTYKTCRPTSKVAFLKLHKCASSSVQNILLRYSLNNKLNLVMPSRGNYLGRKIPYQRSMLADTLWESAI